MAAVAQRPPTVTRRGVGGAARDGFANLVGVGLAATAAFALNIVITRGWSIREAGVFFAATSAFAIAYNIARMGTGAGAVYFLSRHRTLDQRERIRATVAVGLGPVLAVGLLLAVGGWWAAPWLASVIFPDAGSGGVTTLRILFAFVPLAAASDYALAACRGFGKMRPLLLVERVGRNLLQFLLVALAAWLGLSAAAGLPLAWAAPYLLAATVAVAWLALLVRRASRKVSTPVRLRQEFAPFWRFTGPRALSSLAQIVVQRLDIVLLSALRGPVDAAIYTAATRFLALGQLSSLALSSSVQHRLAASLATDDRAEARGLYQTATGWLVLLAWPAYLLFAAFAEPMLALFGEQYLAGRSVVVLLAATMLLATACGMVDTVLNMAGKTAWTFYNALAGTTINVVANLLLIPSYGFIGAAAAWSAAILTTNVVPLIQLWWSMRLHPFGHGTLAAMALATVCFGAPLGGAILLGAPVAGLVAVAILSTSAYAVGAWRLRATLHLDALRELRRRRNRSGSPPPAPAA